MLLMQFSSCHMHVQLDTRITQSVFCAGIVKGLRPLSIGLAGHRWWALDTPIHCHTANMPMMRFLQRSLPQLNIVVDSSRSAFRQCETARPEVNPCRLEG